jgi:hypothetical protein
MYIPDLELCRYARGAFSADNWAVPLRAVGWLDHPHAFTGGNVSNRLTARLEIMVEQSRTLYFAFMGVQDCSLCIARGRVPPGPGWSQENIFVPGKHVVYVAPGGIVHYIEAHSYLPPAEFVKAVFACPEVASDEYSEALRSANGGAEPPLKAPDHPRETFLRTMESIRSLRRSSVD